MGSRRQQGAAFTPLRVSGGEVDGIDEVDPESRFSFAPFSPERSGKRPTERTPVLGSGPREPRRSGGKKFSQSHKAGRGDAGRGEAQRDTAQGQRQSGGQELWYAQSSRPGDIGM